MRHHGQALTHLLADESFRYLGARLMPKERLRLLLLLPGFGRRKEAHHRSGKRVQGARRLHDSDGLWGHDDTAAALYEPGPAKYNFDILKLNPGIGPGFP